MKIDIFNTKNYKEFLKNTSPVYKQCLMCAKKYNQYPKRAIVEVSFEEFKDCNDVRLFDFYAIDISNYLKEVKNIDISYYMDYNGKKIIFYRRIKSMRYKFNVEIPYGKRSQYFDFIFKVNQLVGASGVVSMWVNNIPYALQSFLVIETDENGEVLNDLIKENNLKNDTSKGIDEYISELSLRKWQTMSFPPGGNREIVELAYQLYEFAEEDYLEEKGYRKGNIERKKVFISYCHSDKEMVHEIVDKMEKSGLHLWLDRQEIDAGDCILEEVMSGIEESDLCVTFVGNATVEAQFARYELTTIWHEVIRNQKKWFIIRVDNVDMDKVYYGLSKYLYYDAFDNFVVEDLIKAIARKMSRI